MSISDKKWKLAAGAAVLLLLSAAIVFAVQGKPKTVEVPPQLVKAQKAGDSANAAAGTYAGVVKARYETKMAFQVGGQILSRNVQAGSRVSAGDVLMVINPRDVVQTANAGNAQAESARAKLSLARSNYDRYAELYREEAVPESVLEQYQTEYEAALAAYKAATAQAVQSGNSLGYTNLVAGASGVVSEIQVEEGQIVQPGQAVLTLSQTDELEVEINLPENKLAEAPIGKSVQVNFWALKGSVEGIVREVSPMADNVSRTYRVRIAIPNPPQGMELGMTASVSVSEVAKNVVNTLTVPLSAIYQNGDTPQVWLVEDGSVRLHEVKVISFGDNVVTVEGLQPEDLVVTAGVHKLREGQAVRTEADK